MIILQKHLQIKMTKLGTHYLNLKCRSSRNVHRTCYDRNCHPAKILNKSWPITPSKNKRRSIRAQCKRELQKGLKPKTVTPTGAIAAVRSRKLRRFLRSFFFKNRRRSAPKKRTPHTAPNAMHTNNARSHTYTTESMNARDPRRAQMQTMNTTTAATTCLCHIDGERQGRN
jgi:hypothetical protein